MSTRARIERLERRDAFAIEPRTFWELSEWCEQGRPFVIEPGSRWWPIWLSAQEGTPDAEG